MFRQFFLNQLPSSDDPVKLLGDKLELYNETIGPWADLKKSIGWSQNKFHFESLWEHLTTAYKYGLAYTQDPIFAMICLFHDIGKIQTCSWSEEKQDFTFHRHEYVGGLAVGKWMRENDFTLQESDRVQRAIKNHQYRIYPDTKDKTIKKWLININLQTWQDIRILRLVDRMANKANERKPIIYKLYIDIDNRINKIAETLFQ